MIYITFQNLFQLLIFPTKEKPTLRLSGCSLVTEFKTCIIGIISEVLKEVIPQRPKKLRILNHLPLGLSVFERGSKSPTRANNLLQAVGISSKILKSFLTLNKTNFMIFKFLKSSGFLIFINNYEFL